MCGKVSWKVRNERREWKVFDNSNNTDRINGFNFLIYICDDYAKKWMIMFSQFTIFVRTNKIKVFKQSSNKVYTKKKNYDVFTN